MEFKQQINALKLVPSSGGVFEVIVDSELIYSKKQTGEFPDFEMVKGEVGRRL